MEKKESASSQAASSQPAESKSPRVVMETSMGTIVIELNAEKAPVSVENFLKYVDSGYYDGTIFHRVIPNFMVQGGGFTPNMQQKKALSPIANEGKNGLKNDRGTLAMARTSNPNSATAQFFINVKSNDFLNYPGQDGHGYAVFGKVVEGMDVADKIVSTPTGAQDVPRTPVMIQSVKRQ